EEITMVSVHDVNVLDGKEVFVAEQEVIVKELNDEVNVVEVEVLEVINTAKLIINAAQVSAASATTTVRAATTTTTATITIVDDITLAQALEEMKRTKPK
ncbi:hypothetical protein Tco_0555188, partial [Tanacetum coccineum]